MDNFKSKKGAKERGTQPTINKQQQQQSSFMSPVGGSLGGGCSLARLRWKSAAVRVKSLNDPFCEFQMDAYPVETAIRHRYNAIKKIWTQDECTVRMETKQFECGAMRACFRL
jgi:hypothetical protein